MSQKLKIHAILWYSIYRAEGMKKHLANSRVKGYIDYTRRKQLMIHHSATHLLLGIMRKYFGEHVWQSGVKKDINESRIDITHYRKITLEDIRHIEDMCMEAIEQDRKITVSNVSWNPAIEKYGFRLFEGGVPVSSKIRIVTIDGIDSEGCGGTHLDSTAPIGFIKIMKVETLQEGIQRITFSAGPASIPIAVSSVSLLIIIALIFFLNMPWIRRLNSYRSRFVA